MAHRINHGGRFVAAVDHAIGAFLVVAGAVGVPVGLVHKLLERLGVAFAEQVARPLPAKDIARRISPGRTAIALIAGEKIEKQARLVEGPATAAAAENTAKQLLSAASVEKVVLVGSPFVGVTRRYGDAVDAHRGDPIKEASDPFGLGRIEQGGIDVDAEPALLGDSNGFAGAVENALLTHNPVVLRAVAVEMHRPCKVGMRIELIEFLFEQQGVGAQIDKFLALEDFSDDRIDLAVQQGLTAGENHDRSTAFLDRLEAFGDAEPLVQDHIRIVDLPATRTGKIAAEQGFEHQDQRVALNPAQVAAEHVCSNPQCLTQRNGHERTSSVKRIDKLNKRPRRRVAPAYGTARFRSYLGVLRPRSRPVRSTARSAIRPVPPALRLRR